MITYKRALSVMIEQKNFQFLKHLQNQYVAVKISVSNILWQQDCLQYLILNFLLRFMVLPEGILPIFAKYWRWKGDALRNDRASRIMKELLKESVYYPQIMGKLLTAKKVKKTVHWSLVGRLDSLLADKTFVLGWDEAETGKAK